VGALVRDAFIEQMERVKQCGKPRGTRIRGSHATLFHAELCLTIRELIGEGDALDLLLRDEYNRRKLNLHARAL
jgi:hypothetical protein